MGGTFHATIVALFVSAAAGLAAAEPPKAKDEAKYLDSRQGIEFSYPAEYEAGRCAQCEDDQSFCVGFVRRTEASKSRERDCRFYVSRDKGTLEDAAERSLLFEKINRGWVKHGRFDTQPARPIESGDWQGLFAGASCGVSDENGAFHAGGGTCFTALLSNGTSNVIIEDDGTLGEAVVWAVSQSFRFVKARKPAP